MPCSVRMVSGQRKYNRISSTTDAQFHGRFHRLLGTAVTALKGTRICGGGPTHANTVTVFAYRSIRLYGNKITIRRDRPSASVLLYYFQNLKTIGVFDETDPVCMYVMITLSALITNHYYYSDCLRFSFLHIIERELQQVATEWNHHIIRRTSAAYVPDGCPEVLYFNPDTAGYYRVYLGQEYFTLYRYTGTVDYLQPFDDVDLQFTMHHIPYPDPPLSL